VVEAGALVPGFGAVVEAGALVADVVAADVVDGLTDVEVLELHPSSARISTRAMTMKTIPFFI